MKNALFYMAIFSTAFLCGCQPENDQNASVITQNDEIKQDAPAIPSPAFKFTEEDKKALAALASPLNEASLENGAKQFVKCQACHVLAEGQNLTGPSLYKIYGRKAAILPNYSYSEGLKTYNKNWDYEALNAYLTAPVKEVKGTKMAFAGIKDQQARNDLIAYLAVVAEK